MSWLIIFAAVVVITIAAYPIIARVYQSFANRRSNADLIRSAAHAAREADRRARKREHERKELEAKIDSHRQEDSPAARLRRMGEHDPDE